jgi:hypothetical protein
MNISKRPYGFMINLGFLVILSLCSCSRTSNENIKSVAAEVQEREVAFAKTMEDRDFDSFLSNCSSLGTFF